MNILRNPNEWAQKCEALAAQNERLTVLAAQLKQQNGYLRKANKVQPHVKFVEKAAASAKLLALWHVSGWLTGKESCKSYGMSETTFFWGRGLLMLANLRDEGGWLTDDADTIESKIAMAVSYARHAPEALAQNIPNSRRPKAYRSTMNAKPFGRS